MDELRAAFPPPSPGPPRPTRARLQELTPVHRMIFTVDDHVM